MKTIFKNYLATLRKHGSVALLNLLGLTAAFIAFMLILMQVSFEFGYDRFRESSERLYCFEMQTDFWGDEYYASISRFHGEQVMKLSPAIEESGMMLTVCAEPTFNLPEQPKTGVFRHNLTYCTSRLPITLELESTEGSLELTECSQILIPQSVARRLFGRTSALGAHLRIEGEFPNLTNNRDFYVSGVYKDVPGNSVIRNAFFVSEGNHNLASDATGLIDQRLYIRLHSPQQKESFEALLNDNKALSIHNCKDIRLRLLSDIYFSRDIGGSATAGGNYWLTMIFVSIAALILLIALINYFNFSASLVPLRVQCVMMQKILGSTSNALRMGMILESVLFCVTAYGLALVGLFGVEYGSLMSYLQADMTITDNIPVLIQGAGIAVTLGLVAGIYPAFYATSVQPALCVNGTFGHSVKGKRLRVILIGFQYVIAIGLILSAVFMNLQYRLIRNQSMGFDTDQIVTLPLTQELARQYVAFGAMVQANPDVVEVAYSDIEIIGEMKSIFDFQHGDQTNFRIDARSISPNFIPMMGFRLCEGQNFKAGNEHMKPLPVILNRQAQHRLGVKVGDRFAQNNYEVIGIVEDFHFTSLHTGIGPFMFTPSIPSADRGAVAYLKVKTLDYAELAAEISHIARMLDPDFEAEPQFLNQHIEFLYRSDSQNIALVSFFSVLAIVIALSGIFSLVSLEIRYKRREIGVRRVFGATIRQILGLLNKNYTRMVLLCFALTIFPTLYILRYWLRTYIIQVPMYWWVFALVLLSVWALTSLTIIWLSYRTATSNPANVLKRE